jgi:hypothetical protein
MIKCCKCDLETEVKPHNFCYKNQRNVSYYKCDECILIDAKCLILDGLKKIAHNISFEKIKSILDDGISKES